MAQEAAAASSKQTMDAEILAASKKRALSGNATTAPLPAPKKKRVVKAKAKKDASKVKASAVQTEAVREVTNAVFPCNNVFTCHPY
jgi:hypothetical protein